MLDQGQLRTIVPAMPPVCAVVRLRQPAAHGHVSSWRDPSTLAGSIQLTKRVSMPDFGAMACPAFIIVSDTGYIASRPGDNLGLDVDGVENAAHICWLSARSIARHGHWDVHALMDVITTCGTMGHTRFRILPAANDRDLLLHRA